MDEHSLSMPPRQFERALRDAQEQLRKPVVAGPQSDASDSGGEKGMGGQNLTGGSGTESTEKKTKYTSNGLFVSFAEESAFIRALGNNNGNNKDSGKGKKGDQSQSQLEREGEVWAKHLKKLGAR